MDHLDVRVGSEDFPAADIVEKWLAGEGQQRDRSERCVRRVVGEASGIEIGRRASYRFIDAVVPTRERGIDDLGAVGLIGMGELGSAGMESHRHIEGQELRIGIESDFGS